MGSEMCIRDRRCTSCGEFMLAAEVRHQTQRMRESAEARQYEHMNARQSMQKSNVQEAHVMEAVEFNRAWETNMEEFEQRAAQVVQVWHNAYRVTNSTPIHTFLKSMWPCSTGVAQATRHSVARVCVEACRGDTCEIEAVQTDPGTHGGA